MDPYVAIGVGLAMLAGLTGTMLSPVPGVPLVWTATLVWASIDQTRLAWIVVGIATVLAAANFFVQHRLAGGRWADLAVADRSWIIAIGAGLAGLFLARLPGLVYGFLGGMYVAERRRLTKANAKRHGASATRPARTTTRQRVRLNVNRTSVVELGTALAISGAWLASVLG